MELLRTGVNRLSVHSGLTWDLGKQVLKKTHFYFLHKDLKVILRCKETLVDLKSALAKTLPAIPEGEPAVGAGRVSPQQGPDTTAAECSSAAS